MAPHCSFLLHFGWKVRFYVDGGLDHSVGAHSGNAIGKGDLRRFGIIGTNCEDGSYNTMSNNNDRPHKIITV